jgi:hypothetical protein
MINIRLPLLIAALALTAALGCQKEKIEGANSSSVTMFMPRTMEIQRGQRAMLDVTLMRRDTRREVTLTVSNLPEGVTVEDASHTTAGDEVTFVLEAGDDAALVTDHDIAISLEGPDDMQGADYVALTVRQ